MRHGQRERGVCVCVCGRDNVPFQAELAQMQNRHRERDSDSGERIPSTACSWWRETGCMVRWDKTLEHQEGQVQGHSRKEGPVTCLFLYSWGPWESQVLKKCLLNK